MKTQRVEHRSIFARKMARDLSEQEIGTIAGGHGSGGCLTFSYGTIVDDATGNCQIP